MATEKQTSANRANAQNSTGPTSDPGKARSCRNALRHGLTAKDLFVPPGQEDEFEAFRQDLETSLNPRGPAQMLVYNHILSASWRLLRCDRAESELAARSADPALDPLLDDASHAKLNVIERVRSQASKQFQKSVAELRRIQTEEDYRDDAMPVEEGCDTSGFGLSDSQTIRYRLRKEKLMDGTIFLREEQIEHVAASRAFRDAMRQRQSAKTNPIASEPYGMPGTTDPFVPLPPNSPLTQAAGVGAW
jgi:hypothetical protein